jgi:glyceraldehyde 3-phosphate dehydrogenase
MSMNIKVGINGMGRIGRMVIRSIIESQNKNIEIKHINNRSNSETSCNLIKYDSIHGKFNAELNFDEKHLMINKKKITFSQESNIEDINWKKFDVDYVFECTGKFNSKEVLLAHIKNGAKKVIVSAPCKNADKTIVFGVNENILSKDDQIVSAASCTTNCLAPVANVLNQNFEIEKGFMTTIHAFTSDQRILDNSHKDPRRARSASQSIVPTSTGASKAIGEIIPSLKGKLEGVAMRVPIPNVSLIELVFCTKKEIDKEKINNAFVQETKKQTKRILEITKEKLVSIDFNHNSASAIIDFSLTSVVGKNMGKISAWYDNEWGFSNRMCDIAEHLHKIS